MTPRTPEQNKVFHALIAKHKIDREDKAALVSLLTGGRTRSSAEMSREEMAKAIDRMQAADEASIKRMRAKIYHIARDLFGLAPGAVFEQKHYDAVDTFMRSKFKNPLRHVSQWQLPDAVTAMEAWRGHATRKMIETLLNTV